MTGDCGNRTHPGYMAYEQIASTSNGQIFHLDKSDVNLMLEVLRKHLENRTVNVESINWETSGTFITNVPVDEHLHEITISVSGDYPQINLRDPDGMKIIRKNMAFNWQGQAWLSFHC